MGEQQCKLLIGGVLNASNITLLMISTWRYLEILAGCCVAVPLVSNDRFGSNSDD